ncbi:MAG: hypothetical protein LBT53_08340 [Puniceicoccales bacterium]|nr:hypothetical protein [Puniceicoccales bacterium]
MRRDNVAPADTAFTAAVTHHYHRSRNRNRNRSRNRKHRFRRLRDRKSYQCLSAAVKAVSAGAEMNSAPSATALHKKASCSCAR